jgi:hypothetical protein
MRLFLRKLWLNAAYGKGAQAPSLTSVGYILADVGVELMAAQAAFPAFNSAHEGWAVIQEELDELWDEVRANKGGTATTHNREEMRKEAIQVAAMAARFVHDISDVD